MSCPAGGRFFEAQEPLRLNQLQIKAPGDGRAFALSEADTKAILEKEKTGVQEDAVARSTT